MKRAKRSPAPTKEEILKTSEAKPDEGGSTSRRSVRHPESMGEANRGRNTSYITVTCSERSERSPELAKDYIDDMETQRDRSELANGVRRRRIWVPIVAGGVGQGPFSRRRRHQPVFFRKLRPQPEGIW